MLREHDGLERNRRREQGLWLDLPNVRTCQHHLPEHGQIETVQLIVLFFEVHYAVPEGSVSNGRHIQ